MGNLSLKIVVRHRKGSSVSLFAALPSRNEAEVLRPDPLLWDVTLVYSCAAHTLSWKNGDRDQSVLCSQGSGGIFPAWIPSHCHNEEAKRTQKYKASLHFFFSQSVKESSAPKSIVFFGYDEA